MKLTVPIEIEVREDGLIYLAFPNPNGWQKGYKLIGKKSGNSDKQSTDLINSGEGDGFGLLIREYWVNEVAKFGNCKATLTIETESRQCGLTGR